MPFLDFLTGTPSTFEQVPRFTPQQQTTLNAILKQALSGLQAPLGAGFAPIAQQARTQFAQQTVPTIAERFTAMGGQGGQRSSAFPQLLGQAGAGLEQGLAAQQAQFGLQERQLLQSLLGMGLMPQFETAYRQEQPGFLSGLGGGLGAGIGSILPTLFSGGLGFLGGGPVGAGMGMAAGAAPGISNILSRLWSGGRTNPWQMQMPQYSFMNY